MLEYQKRNKSEYEKEFSETHKCVLTYKGIDVYEYKSEIFESNRLTFWYSEIDSSKYISGIPTNLDVVKFKIDCLLEDDK